MRGVLLIVAVAGCGRLHFDEIGGDGAGMGEPLGCWPAWLDHTVRLGAPRELTELGPVNGDDGDPSLVGNDTVLYFVRGLTRDAYRAQRADRSSPFGAPTLAADVSSAQDDDKLSVTADELLVVVSSNRTGSQAVDLWELTRTDRSAMFASATNVPFTQVNTAANERDPHISGDGLRLYFAAEPAGKEQIQLATRTTRTAAFGPPTNLAGIGPPTTADPTLSPDERVIVFTVGIAPADNQLFYATRTDTAATFDGVTLVPDIHASGFNDGDAALSRDGCELFFMSVRKGPARIFLAAVQ